MPVIEETQGYSPNWTLLSDPPCIDAVDKEVGSDAVNNESHTIQKECATLEDQPSATISDSNLNDMSQLPLSLFDTDAIAEERHQERERNPSVFLKSPFHSRVTDMDSKLTKEEIELNYWNLYSNGDGMELIFEWKDQFYATKEHFESLYPEELVDGILMDIWAKILNDKEDFRSPVSLARFFFSEEISLILQRHRTMESHHKVITNRIFEQIDLEIKRNPKRKLEDQKLLFFPILSRAHFYLLCVNIPMKQAIIIDNSKANDEGTKKSMKEKYQGLPEKIIKEVGKYLKQKEIPYAEAFDKLEVIRLQMPWRTSTNGKDCGVFLLRHMETYFGQSLAHWEKTISIPHDENKQKDMLAKMRIRYLHAILLSHVNAKRGEILERAMRFRAEEEERKKDEEQRKKTEEIMKKFPDKSTSK